MANSDYCFNCIVNKQDKYTGKAHQWALVICLRKGVPARFDFIKGNVKKINSAFDLPLFHKDSTNIQQTFTQHHNLNSENV